MMTGKVTSRSESDDWRIVLSACMPRDADRGVNEAGMMLGRRNASPRSRCSASGALGKDIDPASRVQAGPGSRRVSSSTCLTLGGVGAVVPPRAPVYPSPMSRRRAIAVLLACACNGSAIEGSTKGTSNTSGDESTAENTASSGGSTTELDMTSSGATSSTAETMSSTEPAASSSSTTVESTGMHTTGGEVPCCEPLVDGLPCTDECEHDFADVPQLYCQGTCSPNHPNSCQKEDADLLCKLKLRSPNAYATNWTTYDATDKPGFCCFGFESENAVALGPWPAWGVDIEMCYEPVSLVSHGGTAIQEVECASE